MFTGWWPSLKFPKNRTLTKEELHNELHRTDISGESFDDRGGLVTLNSTYIEWIDRRFLARGSINTLFVLLGTLFFLAVAVFFLARCIKYAASPVDFWGSLGCALIGLFFFCVLYYAQPRLDFFKKIYYPIRFNRLNRMVYVYRDEQDGGVIEASWKKIFFHAGRGMQNPKLIDIRGEIMDGKIVKDTFALGHFSDDPMAIQQMWNFICRYMEGGPEAVGEHPLDRYITLSVSSRFKNCLMMAYGFYGASNSIIRIISLPFIALTTLTRWLVFKTCGNPVWPAPIEEACRVAPDDPNVWPVPTYTGQFAAENPALVDRAIEKVRGANSKPSSLADAMIDWKKDIEKK